MFPFVISNRLLTGSAAAGTSWVVPLTRRFEGETVFVTGAAHGIGLATATAFAAEGAAVFMLDRSEEMLLAALEQVQAAGSGNARAALGDVRSRSEVEQAVEECERELGPIDVCINNVAFVSSTHTLEITDEIWTQTVEASLSGNFRVGQTVARRMADRQKGVIVSTSSTAAIASEPGHSAYGAVKAGVLALTRAMAHDLAPHGIRACALCPGQIDTYQWANLEFRRMYTAGIPAGRFGRPEEVAAVFLYLASDDARHLNGAVFVVDGGMLAWE
jgi:3-oxoacyl-[acyl-carrier protein] reductase